MRRRGLVVAATRSKWRGRAPSSSSVCCDGKRLKGERERGLSEAPLKEGKRERTTDIYWRLGRRRRNEEEGGAMTS